MRFGKSIVAKFCGSLCALSVGGGVLAQPDSGSIAVANPLISACAHEESVAVQSMSARCLYTFALRRRLDYVNGKQYEATQNDRALAILDELLLNRRGKDADKYLVKLLSYYFGESMDGNVQAAVSIRGQRMVPMLQLALKTGAKCDRGFEEICLSDGDDRISFKSGINGALGLIKQRAQRKKG